MAFDKLYAGSAVTSLKTPINDMWFVSMKSVFRSDAQKKEEERDVIAVVKPEYRQDNYYVDIIWHLLYKGFIGCELGQGSASTNVADSENIPEENTFAVWVQGRDTKGVFKCAVVISKTTGEIRYYTRKKGERKKKEGDGGCFIM